MTTQLRREMRASEDAIVRMLEARIQLCYYTSLTELEREMNASHVPENARPPLYSLYNRGYPQTPMQWLRYMRIRIDNYYIQSRQELDDECREFQVPWPIHEQSKIFFQKAANQMMSSTLFMKTEEDSDRVIINPEADVSSLVGQNTRENRIKVFKFVGQFMSFLLINGIKTDLHLSRSIQARFLYTEDEMTREDYILYFLLEFADKRNSFINLMRRPDDIEHSYLEFNDPIMLNNSLPAEAPVTKENFAKYLELTSLSMLKVKESKPYLDALLSGFYVTRQKLRSMDVKLPALDAMMTGSEITTVEIENIISTIRRTSGEAMQSPKIEMFFNILRDGTNGESKFPENVAREQTSTRPQTLEEFKKQLLFFWTGSRFYNSQFNYQVSVPTRATVFKAHTCFQQLEMPTSGPGVKNERAMYEMLVRTVGLEGFGFAG